MSSPDQLVMVDSIASSLLASTTETIVSTTTETITQSINPTALQQDIINEASLISRSIWYISWLIVKLISKILYIVPATVISILSYSFQVNLSFSSIFFIVLITAASTYAFIRYKYLTVYSRLPEEPKRQEPIIDTFLENSREERRSKLSYLDEFISAIKIFGYLDKPVFHELTKSMQTQKLDAGEIVFLDDSTSGFAICVEGVIQVYCKIGEDNALRNGTTVFNSTIENSKDTVVVDGIRYQLLNTIKSGAPLSSLIGVLNMLTGGDNTPNSSNPSLSNPIDNFTLDSTTKISGGVSPGATPSLGPTRLSNARTTPELIAIPSDNCTISIIPRESFSRLSAKYPKATSHIVQMILAKLYRVTFQTSHNYLGLTPDILRTESNLNSTASFKIPKYLYESLGQSDDFVVDQKSKKPSKEITEIKLIKSNRNKNKIRTHNIDSEISASPTRHPLRPQLTSATSSFNLTHSRPSLSSTTSSITGYRSASSSASRFKDQFSDTDESINSDIAASASASKPTLIRKVTSNKSRYFELNSRKATNPGDLLSNAPLTRSTELPTTVKTPSSFKLDELRDRTFSADDEETESSTLLAAISDSLCQLIGIDKSSLMLYQFQKSLVSSRSGFNSPMVSGLSVISNSGEHGVRNNGGLRSVSGPGGLFSSTTGKPRTFSTTSMRSLFNEDLEHTRQQVEYKAYMDFENIKQEVADEIKLFRYPKGTKLIEADEQTPGLYYVISGRLNTTYMRKKYDDDSPLTTTTTNKEDQYEEEWLNEVGQGGLAGYLGTLIGSKSFSSVTASTDVDVAFLSREFFDMVVEKYPNLQLAIAKQLLKVLDKKLFLTDYALEWVHIQAGNSLYMQGDQANGIYIVLNGRFRSIKETPAKTPATTTTQAHTSNERSCSIIGEHGQGNSLGEVEVLTKSKRITTVVAIRDSELARIPRTLFEMIALSNPSIMINVSRIVAERVARTSDDKDSYNSINPVISPHIRDEPLVQSFNNFRTITLLPVKSGVPVTDFGEKLAAALESTGKSVNVLYQSLALTRLGKYAFDKIADLKQSGYFAELEDKYDIVLYLVDTPVGSNWTRTCIQQGDCILLLADAAGSPDIGDYERLLVKTKTTARTELILIHPERYVVPGLTNKWLKNRIWVHSHHHIQMQVIKHLAESNPGDDITLPRRRFGTGHIHKDSIFSNRISKMKSTVGKIMNDNEFLQLLKQTKDSFRSRKYYQSMQVHKDDFMRLARILTGQAIGLVLGGGGARGISQVGVIKALEDHGIPVDMIGGTSIGSFVGGLYAKDYDFVPVFGRAKTFAGRMASIWRSLMDLTIPLTSYVTGHEFNRGIWKAFGESRIEDFWIKYYTNSTNITEYLMEIHTSGYAWRYIRASMSLASLLPPITDNGNMLLDGGYIDNLTVQEMKRRGAKLILACDVGSPEDRAPMDYGDSLSGAWVLFNRFNPFSRYPNIPTMADIQMRLAYVASVNALDKAKNTEGCIYLRPPIEAYGNLDFDKFNEIYSVGLKYGDATLGDVNIKKKLQGWKNKKKGVDRGRNLGRRNSI